MSISYLCENLADRIGFVEPEKATLKAKEPDTSEPVALSEVEQARAGFTVRRQVVKAQENVPEIDDVKLMRSRAGFVE